MTTVARGRDVRRIVAAHGGIISFDVFDTLLWRRTPRPIDVFANIPHSARARSIAVPAVEPIPFATARRQAETDARLLAASRVGTSEVTISDIYQQLVLTMGWDEEPDVADALIAAELGAEADVLVADVELLDLVRKQQAGGRRMVVVSDTYLTSEHVSQLLASTGYPTDAFEAVVTSSEYGVSKSSGLFDVVLSRLGCAAAELLHIGDLPGADVVPLRELGGRTVRWPIARDEAIALTATETGTADLPMSLTHAGDCATAADGGLTSLRARMVFPDDMGTARDRLESGYERFGSLVYGPAMVGFLAWVCGRAQTLGLQRLYLFQREGPFLHDLLEKLQPVMGVDLDLHVLDVSRAALAPARTPNVTLAYIVDQVASRRPRRFADVMTDLGLDGVTVNRWSADDRLTHADAGALRDAIVADRKLLEQAQDHLEIRRRDLYKYVSDHVDLSAERIGVVDLGWAGSIQRSLYEALVHLGFAGRLEGLYLATNSGALGYLDRGNRAEGFLASNGQPTGLEPLFRNLEIIEQSCLAPIGSVRSYDENGAPIRAANEIGSAQWYSIARVQAGAHAFVDEWAVHQSGPPSALDTEVWRENVRRILRRFASGPTRSEIELFRSWRHDDNKGVKTTEQLVPTLFENRSVGRAMLAQHLQMDELLWASAIEALNAPPGRTERLDAVADLADDALGRHVAATRVVAVRDDGDHGSGDVVAAYVGGEARRPTEVRLGLSCGPAIVRIHGVTVEIEANGESRTETFTTFGQIKVGRGAKELSADLAVVRGDRLRLIVPMADIGARLGAQQRVRVLVELTAEPFVPNPNPLMQKALTRGEGVARLALQKGAPLAIRMARAAGAGPVIRRVIGEVRGGLRRT